MTSRGCLPALPPPWQSALDLPPSNADFYGCS